MSKVTFTVYNPKSGEILRWGECPEQDLKRQARKGEAVVKGEYPSDEYFWAGGSMTKKPAAPSPLYEWSYGRREWTVDPVVASNHVRARRDELLQACDWTQLPDVPRATAEAWKTYRQALRDITKQKGFPFTVTWPTPPGM